MADGEVPLDASCDPWRALIANVSGLPELCEGVAALAITAASVATDAGGCEA